MSSVLKIVPTEAKQGLSLKNFPNTPYPQIADYFADYQAMLQRALATVDMVALQQAADILDAAISQGKTVYVCGNGGSAAIANHWVCDFMKGLRTDTDLMPRVHSLSANLELNMAIANDIEYAEVFVYPLRSLANAGDVLLSISSSGNSENVVRAVEWAIANGMRSISLDGFAGGRAAKHAEVSLHVDANNYGLVEDAHHALMHMLAHYLRMKHMPAVRVADVTF